MDEQTYHAGKRGKMTENKRVRKVRVWAETANGLEMVYLGEQKCDNGLWFNSPCHIDKYIAEMDFTGLLDKNGKEIYEGDICKLNGGGQDVFFDVQFEEGCFVARVPWKKEGSPELKVYTFFKPEIMAVEVVGNIYENPELIKS